MMQESMQAAVSEFLRPGNIRGASYYASKIGVESTEFLKAVEYQKQLKFHNQQEATKGFPVMAEALEKAQEVAAEVEEEKRTRRHLSPATKELLIKDILQGHSYKSVAALYDVAESSISKIMKKYREEHKEDDAKPLEVDRIVDPADIGVKIEGDFFVLRIPKNRLTRELLAGVL